MLSESEMEKTARAAFDAEIATKLGPKAQPSDFIDDRDSDTPHHEVYLDSSAGEEEQKMPEADDYDVDSFDKYLGV